MLTERFMRFVLILLAVTNGAAGLWQMLSPETFFDTLADIGLRNDHFIRDLSSIFLALAVGLVMAARRPAWRVPVLAIASVQYAVHTISHIIDFGEGDPSWIGPVTVVLLDVNLAVLLFLLWAAIRMARVRIPVAKAEPEPQPQPQPQP